MSFTNVAFVKKLKAAPDGTPISKTEKLLLYVLADYHNEASGEAWVSLERLAAESLNTPAGVVRIVQGLEIKGVLELLPDHDAPRRLAPTQRARYQRMV